MMFQTIVWPGIASPGKHDSRQPKEADMPSCDNPNCSITDAKGLAEASCRTLMGELTEFIFRVEANLGSHGVTVPELHAAIHTMQDDEEHEHRFTAFIIDILLQGVLGAIKIEAGTKMEAEAILKVAQEAAARGATPQEIRETLERRWEAGLN